MKANNVKNIITEAFQEVLSELTHPKYSSEELDRLDLIAHKEFGPNFMDLDDEQKKKVLNQKDKVGVFREQNHDELSIGKVKNIEIFVNDQSSISDTMFYRLVDTKSGKEFELSVDVAGEEVDLNYVKEENPILTKIGFPAGDAIGNYIVKDINKELNEVDTSLDPLEDRKQIIRQVIELIKRSMPADNKQIKAFIKTNYDDIINLGDDEAILDAFQEFLSVNHPSDSDFTNQKRPSGSDLLDLRILIQQVVGVKTLEDALEVIKRFESKDFKGSPVSPEEAKELIAGLRAKEEDKDDRKITKLMAKAFSIKFNEGSILKESMLDDIQEDEEPTPEEEGDEEAPKETVLEDATDQIIAKFPTLKSTIIKLQTEDFKEFVESIDWISPRPTEFRVNLKNGQEYILKWTGKGFEAQILGKRYFLNNIAEYQQALDKLAILYKEGPLKGAGEGEAEAGDGAEFGGGGGGDFPGDDAAGGGEGDTAPADDTGEEEGGADLSGEPVDFEAGEEPES